MIKLTEHFSLEELTKSATALKRHIDNLPGAPEIANLKRLAAKILEPVRLHYNTSFSPSSGYRSLALNRLVGSSDTSQHAKGEAVDFEVPTVANMDLALWIKDNLIFDQLILEFHNVAVPDSGWCHVSLKKENNRQQCLIFNGKTYKEF